MKEKILEILYSESFKKSLASININYPNVKQEIIINAISGDV